MPFSVSWLHMMWPCTCTSRHCVLVLWSFLYSYLSFLIMLCLCAFLCLSLAFEVAQYLYIPSLYYNNCVMAKRFVPEGITSPVVNTSVLTWICGHFYKFLAYKTKDFLVPGIDYFSHIWHNLLKFWILTALQICTCLALWIFWYVRHWWVLCRRNARLAYQIIIMVPLITIYTTGSMPLLVDVSSPRVSQAQ